MHAEERPVAEASELTPETEEPEVICIPAWGYLRSMWTLFWTAVLHPCSSTTIDLMTGKVVSQE